MIGEQNLDIPDLLQHVEITDESDKLYAALISYAPSQHHSAYEGILFPTRFLTVIRNMVCMIVFIHPYIRELKAAASLHRILAMAGKPTAVC